MKGMLQLQLTSVFLAGIENIVHTVFFRLYNATDDTEDSMLNTLPNTGACMWGPEPVLLGRCGSTTGRSGI